MDITHIKAILLDMDGTLIDTEAFYKKSWQQTAIELNFQLTDNAYSRLIGTPLVQCLDIIRHHLPKHVTPDIFYQHLVNIQNKLKQTTPVPLKPFASHLLKRLNQTGFPTGLVTSSRKKNVEENFINTPYRNTFRHVVTCEDVSFYKPHPEPYLLACQQFSIAPKNALVIEDSPTGARSAIEAGCNTIVIPDISPISEEIAKKTVCLFSSLEQAIEQIIDPILALYDKK